MNANLDKLCMHLTNYAINKFNPKFIFNKNVNNMGIGHKRALSCVYKQLA
jgi:tubulin polyglutamylase TTLL6/13